MKQSNNQLRRILITAYAVNPYKGSEDGMGWNFVLQAAATQRVVAVTRKNNIPHIQKYMQAHPEQQAVFDRIEWWHFDWPKWMIFWKKGPLLSLIYFYFWQLTLALWLIRRRGQFSLVHNLNFHNDWTPSFLWILGKPFIWGPVGHHPKIPAAFLLQQYGFGAYLQDRFLWMIKQWFWYIDPFVYITKWSANHIYCMNEDAARKLRLPKRKYSIMPSVATEPVVVSKQQQNKNEFTVLSVGRFVPLKGFDVTIASFAAFYYRLSRVQQEQARLVLVGAGPYIHSIRQWVAAANIAHCTTIIEWMPRAELEQWYQKSAVFLFPSHEGAGMVVAEAMSYALPVVCFDNAGPGAFVHPHTSLKVPYQSYQQTVQAFAQRLEQLHQSAATYQLEQQLAVHRFNDNFVWNERGRQLSAVYNTILQPTKAQAAKRNLHIA